MDVLAKRDEDSRVRVHLPDHERRDGGVTEILEGKVAALTDDEFVSIAFLENNHWMDQAESLYAGLEFLKAGFLLSLAHVLVGDINLAQWKVRNELLES